MSKTVYIGKPSKLLGKTAFFYLANLKNFGVGRMLTRHEFDAFPEPSYHIVKSVETQMDPELKFGTVWCETVIRGKRLPGIRPLKVGWRPDFRLIARDEEQDFLRGYQVTDLGDEVNVLPKNYTVPPLMAEYMKRTFARYGDGTLSKYLDKTDGRFCIPFVYRDWKDEKEEDAELFWIANRVSKDDATDKATVPFDGKFYFNKDYQRGTTASAAASNSAKSS